jgi:hypothetical protein
MAAQGEQQAAVPPTFERRLSRRKSVADHLATQGGDPVVQGRISRLRMLVKQKVEKLDTQRRLAEQANNILCRKDVRAKHPAVARASRMCMLMPTILGD